MQANGGACLAGSGLDKITDLVNEPEAVAAQQLIGPGPVPGERISELPGVSYLADNLFLGRQTCTVPPPPVWRRVLAASSLVASTRSGMRGGVSPAHVALLATKLRTGRRSSRYPSASARAGGRGSARLHRGGTSGGPRYLALAVSSPSLMTAGCVLAASAMTEPGSPALSYGHTKVTGLSRKARLMSDSCLVASCISAALRPGQIGSPMQQMCLPRFFLA